MKTKRPQFDGPMPTLESMGIIEDKCSPEAREQFQAKLQRLSDLLHEIDPPIEGKRGAYDMRYNPKVYPDGALLRSPDGAGCFILEEMLDKLESYTDWYCFAQKTVKWLKQEATDVMDIQLAHKEYNFIQALTNEANRQGDAEKAAKVKGMFGPNDLGNYAKKTPLN